MTYKRGKFYWYKFMWQGKLVRESTHQGNDKVARNMESAHRTALAQGEVGIREKKAAPTLAEFLKRHFLPFVDTRHAAKPNTLRYYKTGATGLSDSILAGMQLDEINDQHAQQYAARLAYLSPSTVNCGLRTLRRAIYLAAEWGMIDRRPRIRLMPGERQRDRVLSDAEVDLYLEACEQPWKDAATMMLGTGMRPGEVFSLRWENILLKREGGMLQILQGKSKAARRVLPMMPIVRTAFESRWAAQGRPEEGWVFPAKTKSGHLEGYCAKNQHAAALQTIKKGAEEKGVESRLRPFPPYTLRHTALTRLGESGCDAFTLARIAGHSSISITMRYVHPEAEAIETAFARLAAGHKKAGGGHKIGHTREMRLLNAAKKSAASALVRKG